MEFFNYSKGKENYYLKKWKELQAPEGNINNCL